MPCHFKTVLVDCKSCSLTDPLTVHQCMTMTALKASAHMLQFVAAAQTDPNQPVLKAIKEMYRDEGA